MRIWSVISQKGGSGKTTLVLHLAIAAAAKKRTTLVIDLDPQASAERWSVLREADEPTIVAGAPEKLNDMLRAARENGADLVLVDTPPRIDRTALIAAKALARTAVEFLGDAALRAAVTTEWQAQRGL